MSGLTALLLFAALSAAFGRVCLPIASCHGLPLAPRCCCKRVNEAAAGRPSTRLRPRRLRNSVLFDIYIL